MSIINEKTLKNQSCIGQNLNKTIDLCVIRKAMGIALNETGKQFDKKSEKGRSSKKIFFLKTVNSK